MPVLSRKNKETFVIDGCIEFEILNADIDSVRLGIRSPNSIEVRCGEVAFSTLDGSVECAIENECQRNQSPRVEVAVCSNYSDELRQLPNPFVAVDD